MRDPQKPPNRVFLHAHTSSAQRAFFGVAARGGTPHNSFFLSSLALSRRDHKKRRRRRSRAFAAFAAEAAATAPVGNLLAQVG